MLPLSSVVIIAIGAATAIAGNATLGIVIAAVGVIDLATVPLVLRRVGQPRATKSPSSSSPDAAADPSYNPYARED